MAPLTGKDTLITEAVLHLVHMINFDRFTLTGAIKGNEEKLKCQEVVRLVIKTFTNYVFCTKSYFSKCMLMQPVIRGAGVGLFS
jgi:hypothetical protein